MERRMVKTGLIQMACVADKKANVEKTVDLIRNAAGKGAHEVIGHAGGTGKRADGRAVRGRERRSRRRSPRLPAGHPGRAGRG